MKSGREQPRRCEGAVEKTWKRPPAETLRRGVPGFRADVVGRDWQNRIKKASGRRVGRGIPSGRRPGSIVISIHPFLIRRVFPGWFPGIAAWLRSLPGAARFHRFFYRAPGSVHRRIRIFSSGRPETAVTAPAESSSESRSSTTPTAAAVNGRFAKRMARSVER